MATTTPAPAATTDDPRSSAAEEKPARKAGGEADAGGSRESTYVVLISVDGGPFVVGPEVTVRGGQVAARKAAVESRDDLRKQIEAGDAEVVLAAVPLASWQPQAASVYRPPARLIV